MSAVGPQGQGAGAVGSSAPRPERSGAVRPLVPADVSAVAALERELFAPSAWSEAMIREELTAPGRHYLALDDADGLVGYAGSWFDGDVSQVMTIGVAPRAQRRGLGRTLLRALLDHARGVGASAVFLEVRVDNEPALALYRDEGFEVLTRRKRYYQPEDVDAWTMRLVL